MTKSEEAINIKIPNNMGMSAAEWDGYILAVVFQGIWLSPFMYCLWVGLTGPGDIITQLFCLIFIGLPTLGILWSSVKHYIKSWLFLQWQINRHNFIQEYRLLGLCWRRCESRSAIAKVTYCPTHYRDTAEGRVKEQPKLILHIGVRENLIYWDLTEVELEWLAFELSDWLDIPINKLPA